MEFTSQLEDLATNLIKLYDMANKGLDNARPYTEEEVEKVFEDILHYVADFVE